MSHIWLVLSGLSLKDIWHQVKNLRKVANINLQLAIVETDGFTDLPSL